MATELDGHSNVEGEEGPGAARAFHEQVSILTDLLSRCLAAEIGIGKARIRGAYLRAIWFAATLVGMFAAVFAAVIMLLSGIALGISDIFGQPLWVALVLEGTLVLAICAAALFAAIESRGRVALENSAREWRERFGDTKQANNARGAI